MGFRTDSRGLSDLFISSDLFIRLVRMEKLVGFWNGQKIRKLWKILMGLGTNFFVQLPLVAEKKYN